MDDVRLIHQQFSAAEVPGFHARTVIDDTIGKLYALRTRLVTDLPTELPALLDDIEERVEALVELAYDSDAAPVEDGVYRPNLPEPIKRYCGGRLSETGSSVLGWCSCGNPSINP